MSFPSQPDFTALSAPLLILSFAALPAGPFRLARDQQSTSLAAVHILAYPPLQGTEENNASPLIEGCSHFIGDAILTAPTRSVSLTNYKIYYIIKFA